MIFVGSQAWEWKNFIKGEYGAVETKGGSLLQFVDSKGNRVALEKFAAILPEEREQLTRAKGRWFMEESSISDISVPEVIEGFKTHPDLFIRTEVINSKETLELAKGVNADKSLNATKHKIILSRAESEKRLASAHIVVQGANLQRNEYGSKLFADFFFFITGFHGFHVFSGVIINIIIFINILLGTYENGCRKSIGIFSKRKRARASKYCLW